MWTLCPRTAFHWANSRQNGLDDASPKGLVLYGFLVRLMIVPLNSRESTRLRISNKPRILSIHSVESDGLEGPLVLERLRRALAFEDRSIEQRTLGVRTTRRHLHDALTSGEGFDVSCVDREHFRAANEIAFAFVREGHLQERRIHIEIEHGSPPAERKLFTDGPLSQPAFS